MGKPTITWGYHTLDFTLLLKGAEAKHVLDWLHAKAKGRKHRLFKNPHYESVVGVEEWVSKEFDSFGVILYLLKQKPSKNQTTKPVPPSLRLRINLHTLVEGEVRPEATGTWNRRAYNHLESTVDSMFHEMKLPYDFSDTTLSRVDVAMDYYATTQEEVDERLRLLRKSPIPARFQCATFSAGVPNSKEKNAHSLRYRTNTVQLTLYDKKYQMIEEQLVGKKFKHKPILRIELMMTSAKIYSTFPKKSHENALNLIWINRGNLMSIYLKQMELGQHYYKAKQLKDRIECSGYDEIRRYRMVKMVESCKKHWSYESALSDEYFRTYEKQLRDNFAHLDMSPVPLRRKCAFDSLVALSVYATSTGKGA